MPRKKKDGRFINYYIDRTIFERLERYADDHSLPMTNALERILEEHLDRYGAELAKVERYCPDCHILVRDTRCPRCGRKWLDEPAWSDHCFLTEQEGVWAGVFEDCLRQNKIAYVTENVRGAGITARLGTVFERKRFFVRYDCYEQAKALLEELFAGEEGSE